MTTTLQNRPGAGGFATPNDEDLTIRFTVTKTPEAAYAAILDVRRWWSENIEGETDVEGAEWIYHNEPIHYSKFRTAELVPGKRVVWDVIDTEMSFIADKGEWNGHRIVFDIAATAEGAEVTFTQVGLVPKLECYAICKSAWTGYITGSLRALILIDQGAPIRKAN